MSSLLLAAGIEDIRSVVAINVGIFIVIMIGMTTGGKLLDTFGRRNWTREYWPIIIDLYMQILTGLISFCANYHHNFDIDDWNLPAFHLNRS